jgi:hypothetical protein
VDKPKLSFVLSDFVHPFLSMFFFLGSPVMKLLEMLRILQIFYHALC